MCLTEGTAEIVKRHWLGTFLNQPKEYWKLEGNVEVRDFLSVKPSKGGSIMVKSTSGKEKTVKFDCVVGNPPYQIGSGHSLRSLYDAFVLKAIELDPQYISMVIPARWLSGNGKGIADFTEKMLHGKHLATIRTTDEAKEWFPDVNIEGGAMYFLYDRSKNDYVAEVNGISLNLEHENTVITNPFGLSIRNKVMKKTKTAFSDVILGTNPFDIATNHSEWAISLDDTYVVYTRGQIIHHIKKAHIRKGLDRIGQYKVCTARGNGSDGTGKIFVIKPNEIVSDTYLVLACFNSE